MKIIGLEEHFVTADVLKAWQRLGTTVPGSTPDSAAERETARRLIDIGDERFAAMAEVGLDTQVLSLTAPGVQNLAPGEAVALQTASNDMLAERVRAHPDRLQGFATLATPAPEQAARELERAVSSLGLNGAMLFGRTGDHHLDDPEFWPIFEAAAALRAPLYLHPQSPPPTVRSAYYNGFGDTVDTAFATYGIGWHYETGIQLLRLILSGVFDRFPELQIIVGHWGEVVLFYLDRIDELATAAGLARRPSEYVRTNVLVTPSGIYSQRYLRWAIEIVGIDRILFSTDYPYQFAPQGGARRFVEEAEMSTSDRDKIASGTWERLVAGILR